MKIVCDACSAKYSIADEKVAGKVFKIRCKKCSNIIVVRGTAAEEPAQDPYAQQDPYGGYGGQGGGDPNAVWHLVVNQEQIGPLTDAEVRQRFASGEVDLETYTWREGFDNWSPLGQVDVFTDLATGGAGGAAGGDAVSNMFGNAQAEENATVQQDPADLFAAAAAPGGDDGAASDLFGARPGGGGDDGLFGGGAAAEESPPAGGGIQMSADAERRLRGERNENSVLFSLNNLAALASESPKAPRASGGGGRSGGGGGGGAARPQVSNTGGSEGSGLIDIRAMANVYHGDSSQGASAGGSGSADDLPVFGQSSFASAAPVILPASNASNSNKTLYIMLGVIGLLVAAAAILVVMVVKGDDDGEKRPAVAANVGGDTDGTDKTAPGTDTNEKPADDKATKPTTDPTAKPPEDKPTDPPATDATDSKPADKTEDKTSDKSSKASASRRSSRSSSRRSSSKKSSSKKTTEKPPPRKKSSSGCLDEVGCLLADKPPSCCSKYSGGSSKKKSSSKKSSSGSTSSKEKLTRSDISSGMSKVKGRVTSCGSRHPGKGTVKIKVKVGSNGKVSSAKVKSSPNASLGSCVSSAVKKAKFPASQKGASFTYPFVF